MRIGFRSGVLCLLCFILAGSADACRFWGLVGGDYPTGLISDHLRDGTVMNLRQLGANYHDGWGIAYVLPTSAQIPLTVPIFRRGGPSANDPSEPEFGMAVDELALIRPPAALAHIRRCSTDPCGIPDPHPFHHEGVTFAHQGTISDSVLVDLLTRDDPHYLVDHPPDYLGEPVDSELYLLYLLKYCHQHSDLPRPEAIRRAVSALAPLTSGRLNFVLLTGDTLFALRHSPSDGTDPVRYYPATSGPSPFWIAASEVLGSSVAGWGEIPAMTLAVLVPGVKTQFLPINEVAATGGSEGGAALRVGQARPNPAAKAIRIPLSVPSGGAAVKLEVWDAQGRLVWEEGPRQVEAGERQLSWEAVDQQGRQVPSGTYFCSVSAGGTRREQRITVVR